MNVQFKVVRKSADKVYILSEITGYDERWPVVLTASTEHGIRIPSDTFPYCDENDLIAVESVLYNAAVANHACTLPYLHTKNSAGVRFFVIVLPWLKIRKYILEFKAIDANGAVVEQCKNRLDVNSARWFSLLDSRINQDAGDAIELLDTRFVHDRIHLSFVRVLAQEEKYLVSALVEMPYHKESVIEFDFLDNTGSALSLDYRVIEDSIAHSVDFGSFEHRYMMLSFEVYQENPEVCLCATDTAGNIAPGFAMLGSEQLEDLLDEIKEATTTAYRDEYYDDWFKEEHAVNFPTLLEQVSVRFDYAPLISVLCMVNNTPQHHLYDMISSMLMQSYGKWELILVNVSHEDIMIDDLIASFGDERVYVLNVDPVSPAAEKVNAGILASEGEFIGLMRACDKLSPDALFEYVRAMNEHPTCDVLYGDSDTFDVENRHSRPIFRPAFSPELLRSCNYIQDFFLIRATLFGEIGMIQKEFRGAFGYDMLLRSTEQARFVAHIPRVLYHARYAQRLEGEYPSSEFEQEAGRRALVAHCKRVGIQAEVMNGESSGCYRVRHLLTSTPAVTIVIPSENNIELLTSCIRSLYNKIHYRNFEVLVVDVCNPQEKDNLRKYDQLLQRYDTLSVISWYEEFNRARIANYAASRVESEFLLFLNDDTRVITDDVLDVMMGYFQSENVGVVGPKQLFVDGTIEHAGLVVGGSNTITPLSRYMSDSYQGYFCRACVAQNVSAVTGDCMMIRRSVFERVGGFTEEFSRFYSDVDFCLKAFEQGFYTVFTPYAKLSHFRSVSRVRNYSRAERITKKREAALLQYHWPRYFVDGDALYNPNLDQDSPYFALDFEEDFEE